MSARYLLRLDDASPTMNHDRWIRLEAALDAAGIRPIVAVVPDNADPDLHLAPPDPDFWGKVRAWQAKGWTIGMHGHRHVFHPISRSRLLLPFYDKSEFAGLPLEEQRAKIRAARAVFDRERVRPEVWVAPAHCFDHLTLQALTLETGIRIVSDGLAIDQFHEHGVFWLPQQLWLPQPRRSGLWTICLHPSSMSEEFIDRVGGQLRSAPYRGQFVSVPEIPLRERRRSVADWLFEQYFWSRGSALGALTRLRAAWRS